MDAKEAAAGMSAPIKVTVAIPTYNRADFLRQALAGIVTQQFPREHFEVLVIDNNSTDHTRAVVHEFAGGHPAPRFVQERKQGLDYARNRAIDEARGEIILFGDDDILVRPDWIAQMAVALLADRGRHIGAVGGEVIPVFPHGLPDWVREWHSPLAFRVDAGPLEPRHSPMGANLAFPKWVFEQVGKFHTKLDRAAGNYFSGGDAEMIRRVRAAGFEVWFNPAASVQHQMPASRTTFRYASRHAFDSARSRVIDRAGQPGAFGYLFGRFFANIAKAFGFLALAAVNTLCFRTGAAKQGVVRAWRSCGYVYQILRSSIGRV
jgi:glycosyltransferase involved in cell wall biosynthesis